MEITIEVPSPVYLIPLTRAVIDYCETRRESNGAEIQDWVNVMHDVRVQLLEKQYGKVKVKS